jgi:hypothetical protein
MSACGAAYPRPVTEPPAGHDPPPLGSRDIYVYALGNGALFLLEADGAGGLLPLAEVLAMAEARHAVGGKVLVGWDDTPIATGAVAALRARGIPLVVRPDEPVPRSWHEGTDALMEAAAGCADALLDDLVARGADVHHRDVSGSTALHHAAAHGNLHAIRALVSVGADRDLANRDGLTPLEVARATRQEAAARLLVELGAEVDVADGRPVQFRGSHAWSMWYLALLPIPMLITAVAFLWPLSVVDAVVVAAVATAYLWLSPPRVFWAGGVPRALAGDRLFVRTLAGRRRMVDLADVTAAALAGAGRARAYGGRTLLLAHPDGHTADARQLRNLGLPRQEADAIADRFERVVVVPISGAHREEVILAVGNRLSGLGVDLSANLRHQLAAARGLPPSGR